MWVVVGMIANNGDSTLIIGITGITGSGTSSVAKILEACGGFVISADKLVHGLMLQGQPAYSEIVEIFGDGVLGADDEIDRRALGGMVFGNKERLTQLENVLHPMVIEKTKKLLSSHMHYSFAVIDAPLLIESGMNKLCFSTWLITAPDSLRMERIQARDKLTHEAAEHRIRSRPGDDVLRPDADIIIENAGGLSTLEKKAHDALASTMQKWRQ